MLKRLGIALFWLALWQILALLIHNPVLLVGPWETLRALMEILPTAEFRRAVFGSVAHILGGFLLGAVLGLSLAFLSCRRPFFRDLLRPVIGVMKAVPWFPSWCWCSSGRGAGCSASMSPPPWCSPSCI